MSLDTYRINWRESARLRKQAVDNHLAQFRKGDRPKADVDIVVFAVVLIAVLAIGFYMLGLDDGTQLCRPLPFKGVRA